MYITLPDILKALQKNDTDNLSLESIDVHQKFKGYTPLAGILINLYCSCRNNRTLSENTEILKRHIPIFLELLKKGSDIQDIFSEGLFTPSPLFDKNPLFLFDPEMYNQLTGLEVSEVFFDKAASYFSSITSELYKVFIMFLLLGLEIISDHKNTTLILDTIYDINRQTPNLRLKAEEHPIFRAWNNIKDCVQSILQPMNIHAKEEEVSRVLHFLFSVYKRQYKNTQRENESVQYFAAVQKGEALTQQEDKELRQSNVLWLLRVNCSEKRPQEITDLMVNYFFEDKVARFSEFSYLPFFVLKKLYLGLIDPSSPIARFREVALQHPWEEGPLSLDQTLDVHLQSPRPSS